MPILGGDGADAKKCHALSAAIMFFLSIVSAVGNAVLGYFPVETVKPLLPAGVVGAAAGALLLRRTDNDVLRRIFGVLLIYSGGRILLQ